MIQVYTGDGKGKTTASLGLIVRAAGAGQRVAFIQFDKGHEGEDFYHERNVLRRLPHVDLFPTGCQRMRPGGQFRLGVTDEDRREAARGLELTHTAIKSGAYDLVVADEILSSATYGLIEEAEVMRVVRLAREHPETELVLTGRGATRELIDEVDLVTEMRKVKHYFDRGIAARRGIEY